MHLVNGHGGDIGILFLQGLLIVLIVPLKGIQRADPGAGLGPGLAGEGEGISLFQNPAVPGGDAELVDIPGISLRDERGPHPALQRDHGVGRPVPAVEVADDGYLLGMGRPDHKAVAPGIRQIPAAESLICVRSIAVVETIDVLFVYVFFCKSMLIHEKDPRSVRL